MIAELFTTRKNKYYASLYKILRLVFNDQFLGFIFLVGSYLFYLYITTVINKGISPTTSLVLTTVGMAFLLLLGKLTVLMADADRVVLMNRPKQVKKFIKKGFASSWIKAMLIQIIGIGILVPLVYIYWGVSSVVIILAIQLVTKTVILLAQLKKMVASNGVINWQYILDHENRVMSKRMNLLGMFTDIRGNKPSKHPTKMYDGMLNVVRGKNPSFYTKLFTSKLIRSREYLGKISVVFVVGMLLMFGLNDLVPKLLAILVIDIALIYQLKPLFSTFDTNKMVIIRHEGMDTKITSFNSLYVKIVPVLLLIMALTAIISTYITHPQTQVIDVIWLVVAPGIVVSLNKLWILPKMIGYFNEIKK